MIDWMDGSILLATSFGGDPLVTSIACVLLGQDKGLSRDQKSRLLSAFLSLLAIAVCLVLMAFWMSRAMRKYMRDEPSPDTPLPETDLWQMRPASPLDDGAEDGANHDTPTNGPERS